MKISEAISIIILSIFGIFVSILGIAFFFGAIVAICAVPVYLFCLIFGVSFSWAYAAVLAVIAIIVCGIVDSF